LCLVGLLEFLFVAFGDLIDLIILFFGDICNLIIINADLFGFFFLSYFRL